MMLQLFDSSNYVSPASAITAVLVPVFNLTGEAAHENEPDRRA